MKEMSNVEIKQSDPHSATIQCPINGCTHVEVLTSTFSPLNFLREMYTGTNITGSLPKSIRCPAFCELKNEFNFERLKIFGRFGILSSNPLYSIQSFHSHKKLTCIERKSARGHYESKSYPGCGTLNVYYTLSISDRVTPT